MIARLIQVCIGNRVIVLMLAAFVVLAGVFAVRHLPIDAIPDLSDVQVVIRTEFPGQAPQIVEDQVTYPLTTTMLAVPQAKVVRGYSMFGTSFVYVISADGTDQYWARSRVLEQLSFVSGKLPGGTSPQLGPDATGVGWVYEYALVTGHFCADHPNGAWHDAKQDRWFDDQGRAGLDEAAQAQLVHHRVFDGSPGDHCPLDGKALQPSTVDLAQLRSLQDWYLRYELTALEGVSEIAAVGGFQKQYQVVVDPVKLLGHDLSLTKVKQAVQRSNLDVGGRLVEASETEFMVRGIGYLGSLSDAEIVAGRAAGRSLEELRSERVLGDLAKISLGASVAGAPIYLRDVAELRLGPEIRRGVVDWNGEGEATGGIVVMRSGANARATIQRVRQRLGELERGLPAGVAVETAYDRSDLIERSVATLTSTLLEEILVVSLVCALFLLHARSALVAVFVLPTGVLVSLALMYLLGFNANIMSLGGIAIAIGVMVDSAIIMVENAHKHLELDQLRVAGGQPPTPRAQLITAAACEVGPSLFFSLLIITVSFLPVFALGEQSGRLFRPLAFTKTFAMATAAVLAVTVIPVLMTYLIGDRVLPVSMPGRQRRLTYLAIIGGPALLLLGLPLGQLAANRYWLVLGWLALSALLVLPQRILGEDHNPISRLLERLYDPLFRFVMQFRWLVLVGAVLLVALTAWPFSRLGSEFMPPLEEGDLLYMPTTDPGISVGKARELLQQTDAMLRQFPEVKCVLGKIGRADTATDPAPPSMLETTITLHRDPHRWRQRPVARCFGDWPDWAKAPLRWLWPEQVPISVTELIYGYEWPDGTHVPGMNEAMQIPGLTNAWTMPIKTRIDMLSTGIKTPVGIKVMGPDLGTLAVLAEQITQAIKSGALTGPHTVSAFAEKSVGGNYLDIRLDRDQIARFGLSVGDVQDVVMSAIGGVNVSWTVEGLERYSISVRYPHELRDNLPALRQVLVPTMSGAHLPLSQLAQFEVHKGPPMVKSENARLTSWVYVDIVGIDVGTYVQNAQLVVDQQVRLPPGYTIVWSGQFEYMQRTSVSPWSCRSRGC